LYVTKPIADTTNASIIDSRAITIAAVKIYRRIVFFRGVRASKNEYIALTVLCAIANGFIE
jgi:hypothetical protein